MTTERSLKRRRMMNIKTYHQKARENSLRTRKYPWDDFDREFIDRVFVGWDRVHNELANINGLSRDNYPRYNLIKGENKYRIEMGLAGWDRDSIKITQDKGTLTIEGVDKQELDIEKGERYLYKGISGKTFRKVFTLGEFVNVSEADFSDGMLTVNLKVDTPESEKPKLININ